MVATAYLVLKNDGILFMILFKGKFNTGKKKRLLLKVLTRAHELT
jgi:hypothetical protein